MTFEITIPRLGWSMEEGTFVRWLKKDGDTVKPGEPLFELEGEKAAQDIEAVDGGILRIPPTAPQPGTIVAVGSIIGFLVTNGEIAPTPATPAPAAPKVETSPQLVPAEAAPPAAPSVRRMAREMGVSLAKVAGSGPAGRISATDLKSAPPARTTTPPVTSTVASPRARRVAKELGIDWASIAGTGRDGRVREQDVRSAPAKSNHRANGTTPKSPIQGTTIPISKHRRTTADRMSYSSQNTAPVTLTTRIDATNLVSLRQQFKAAGGGGVPSYTDIIIKLVAMALAEHPLLMAQWSEDQITIPTAINIGLAVDTEAGLLVPVVQNVGSLALTDISLESVRLIELARQGKLKASDMQDGVFTVTNLGSFGIDTFTPIINSPETAILGLGRIRREPAIVENQIVPRDQMSLSLTFDHRIVDGAPAARFLQTVSQALETPSAWLLRTPV
jgi:pyruvate dehydrogenase E2 component (dihydrolipoamide acetyltransferase)